MRNVYALNHPLLQHKITLIRDENTGSKQFRELVKELSLLMAYEVTRDFPLVEVEVQTPVCKTMSKIIGGRKVGIVQY